jgi:hypothetical protein
MELRARLANNVASARDMRGSLEAARQEEEDEKSADTLQQHALVMTMWDASLSRRLQQSSHAASPDCVAPPAVAVFPSAVKSQEQTSCGGRVDGAVVGDAHKGVTELDDDGDAQSWWTSGTDSELRSRVETLVRKFEHALKAARAAYNNIRMTHVVSAVTIIASNTSLLALPGVRSVVCARKTTACARVAE